MTQAGLRRLLVLAAGVIAIFLVVLVVVAKPADGLRLLEWAIISCGAGLVIVALPD